jgi:hypothetical protein
VIHQYCSFHSFEYRPPSLLTWSHVALVLCTPVNALNWGIMNTSANMTIFSLWGEAKVSAIRRCLLGSHAYGKHFPLS